MEADITLEALRLPRQTLEEKISLFERSLEQAARDRRLIADVLEGDKRRMTVFLEEQALVRRSTGQESVAVELARLGGIVAQLEKLKAELGVAAGFVNPLT
jgi:hypothetical protein